MKRVTCKRVTCKRVTCKRAGYNEMFKLALANASRHVLLRSKVLEEVVL